jgi:hypothetical protein
MRPISDKERKFLKKWKEKRRHKWRYILRNGILWGFFVSFFSYLLIIRLDFSLFEWSKLITRTLVFCLVGIFSSYFAFKGRDKRYLKVIEEEGELD